MRAENNPIIITFPFPHLAGLAAQSLSLPPESQEVRGGSLSPQHVGTLRRVALQLRPQVGQARQEALQGIGLRCQGVCVAPHGAEGVQLIVEVGEAREDVAHVRLDLADTLETRLQGGAALLDLMERGKV